MLIFKYKRFYTKRIIVHVTNNVIKTFDNRHIFEYLLSLLTWKEIKTSNTLNNGYLCKQ